MLQNNRYHKEPYMRKSCALKPGGEDSSSQILRTQLMILQGREAGWRRGPHCWLLNKVHAPGTGTHGMRPPSKSHLPPVPISPIGEKCSLKSTDLAATTGPWIA